MKAYLHAVRIAPKKLNLIALMVRGMNAADAMEALRLTNKKGARIIEKLLRSAMANASHNEKQDPQTMVIKSIIVNQGTAYKRGMPKARGQMRPYRKFLSHLDLELGFPNEEKSKGGKKAKKAPSQKSQDAVQKGGSTKTKAKTSATKDSAESTSSSAA